MDCDAIQHSLQQRAPLGDAARAHLATCAACRALVAVAPQLAHERAAAGVDEGAAWAATLAALEAEQGVAGRMRARSGARRLLLSALACALVPLLVGLGSRRPDLGEYPATRLGFELTGFAIVIALALIWAMRPLQRAASRGAGPLAWAAALAIAAIVASLPTAHLGHGGPGAGLGAELWPRALACLGFGSACAVPSLVLLRMLARDGDRPGLRALVLAAASAAVGTVSVFLHCPIVAHEHLWLGHVTVLVPLSAWAVWAMRPRARA